MENLTKNIDIEIFKFENFEVRNNFMTTKMLLEREREDRYRCYYQVSNMVLSVIDVMNRDLKRIK